MLKISRQFIYGMLALPALMATTSSFAADRLTNKAIPKMNMDVKKVRTLELPKAAAPEKTEPVKKAVAPTPTTFTSAASNVDGKLESAVDREISELVGLVKKYSRSERTGRLLMRLGEAYGEKARLVMFRLLEAHSKTIAQGKGLVYIPPPSMEEAYNYNLKAVEAFKGFLRDYPSNNFAPTATYLMGYNYFEAKRPQEGEEALSRVVYNYPNSQAARAAQLQLAEHLFERREWKKAMALYTDLMGNKVGTNSLIARYKHAWCRFHTGEIDLSLEEMKSVYSAIRKDNSDATVGLADETAKSLLFLFTQSGRYNEAADYLRQNDKGEKLANRFAALAANFHERGDVNGTVYLYSEALKISPNHPRAVYFEYDMIPKDTSVQNPDAYHASISALVKKYGRNSQWANNNKSGAESALKLLEEKTFAWVMYNHRGLQFLTRGVTFDRTKQAYELYFANFDSSANAETTHYFYGDLLFDNEHYEKAAEHYERLAKNPSGKYYHDALLNAVLARDKTLPKEDDLKKIIDQPGNTIEFSQNIKLFQAAAERYLKEHSKDKPALQIRYRLALLNYTHKRFPEAETGFKGIIKDYPDSEYAQYSAHIVLDIYDRRGDYETFVATGKEFMKNPNLSTGKTGDELRELIQRASFKFAQLAQENKSAAAGKSTVLFLAYTKEYSNSPLAGLAHFNAAVNQEKDGDLINATENYEKSLQSIDKSKYELKARQALSNLYNKLGQYHLAAAEYDKQAQLTLAGNAEKADLLFKAGALWFSLNRYDTAQDDFQKAMELDPKLKNEITELMVDVSEAQHDWAAAIRYSSALIAANQKEPKVCALILRRARLERDSGNLKSFYDGLTNASTCFDKLEELEKKNWAAVGANSKYLLAMRSLETLKAPLTKSEQARRQKVLENKLNALNLLDNEFKEVIKLNVSEYIVKALAAEADAYRFLAKFVDETPVPNGLDGDSLKEYKDQVGEIVGKMQKESGDYLALAAKKSAEFKILARLDTNDAPAAQPVENVKLNTKDKFN